MNLSGQAVVPLARYFDIHPSRWVVVHDEMDLPLGKIKWKRSGGAGGHKGVASIMEHLGHGDFRRARLGVGRPAGNAVGHVLGTFGTDEAPIARAMVEEAADLVLLFARGGDKGVNDRLARREQDEKRSAGPKAVEPSAEGNGNGGDAESTDR